MYPAPFLEQWDRVDILVNNAGFLRDKSFTKISSEDFQAVMNVHLNGSVNCSKAVWEIMREQNYGRIVMTTSASGLYGNFGQSNYAAAKMAVVGLMNTLVQEGKKYDIRVNALSPVAGTQMTEGMVDTRAFELMAPESVSPGLLALCCEDAPSRLILCAGAGTFAATHIHETAGIYLAPKDQTPENVIAQLERITDPGGEKEMSGAIEQLQKFVGKALSARDEGDKES